MCQDESGCIAYVIEQPPRAQTDLPAGSPALVPVEKSLPLAQRATAIQSVRVNPAARVLMHIARMTRLNPKAMMP